MDTNSNSIIDRAITRLREHYVKPIKNYGFSAGYRRILGHYLRLIIPENVSVLEVGCGVGGLLQELPQRELHAIDLSEEQIKRAKDQISDVEFSCAAGETATFERTYDYILLSDTLNEAADVQRLLENICQASTSETRLVITSHNTLWRPFLGLARWIGLKPKRPDQNWLSRDDIFNLLHLGGWEAVRQESRILVPHEMWGLGTLINRCLAPLIPCACLSLFFVARKRPVNDPDYQPSVTVIIPARNEAGNLPAAIERTPMMGSSMEILFIEGNSSDGTWDTIQSLIEQYPDRDLSGYQQTGKGKGDAMRLGYEKAKNEVIMILDADLTVAPEDLPKFYEALRSGEAEFVNGVRLVYPMEDEAMRFLNMCGNKFFSMLFSWLLNMPIKDTLCGTKVFTKTDYERIEANRAYFGDFDPFGDFDLIFGAAKLNMKIRDLPIRYQNRTYGEPQIDRWRDGSLLIRMGAFAARKLKFT